MISRAQEGQPHIKLLDFLCANKYLQKKMFKTKTHPYHGKHIREGYRDQSAKPTLSPIVKKRWAISFSIKIIFQMQVLHWCDLSPCVPLLPGCLGPGGCPGSQVWRHSSYALSNRFNGNDKMTLFISEFSLCSIQSNYWDIWFTLECLKWLLDQFNFVYFQFQALL